MTIAHRDNFATYADYVYHQGGKARGNREQLLADLPKKTTHYQGIFRHAAEHLKAGSVLCLGARTGAESLGALRAGFEGSVGVDLHPVGPTVLQGDWHSLPQFEDGSFDNAYCNSLDHCLYLDQFSAEVKRILRPDGRLYLMATNREGNTIESWRQKWSKSNEALYWQTSDDLCAAVCAYGFTRTAHWRTGKWGHDVLKVSA